MKQHQFAGAFLPPEATTSSAFTRIQAEIVNLGLAPKIFDLDVQGFTILSPHELSAGTLADELLEAMLEIAEAKCGTRPNLDTTLDQPGSTAVGDGLFLHHML